ncbi:MAG: hypothetical protein E6J34_04670 [Chloroflexi bacterium]|nr:MAG: hypothetical protein E6J34_04670 [Chloroflexota bacterium]
MQYVLWTVLSLALYVSGLLVILKATPQLLIRSFDEGLFMGVAAVAILGAILAFGAVVITLAIFNGALLVRAFDFLLLVGIVMVVARVSFVSSRATAKGIRRTSRIIVMLYGLILVVAALYYIVQIFTLRAS